MGNAVFGRSRCERLRGARGFGNMRTAFGQVGRAGMRRDGGLIRWRARAARRGGMLRLCPRRVRLTSRRSRNRPCRTGGRRETRADRHRSRMLRPLCCCGGRPRRRLDLRRMEHHRRLLQRRGRHMHRRRRNRIGVGEDPLRNNSSKPPIGEIRVRDLRRRRPVRLDYNIIDILDVGNVDVANVVHVVGITRPIGFAGGERKPADSRSATCGKANSRDGADKGDKGRRIDRLRHVAAGDPAPSVVHIGPAAIMKWREAPGLLVDPGPAPGLDPDPTAVAIGRPIRRHLAWIPDFAVLRVALPAAVMIEIRVAGHLRRNIMGRRQPLGVIVVRGAPFDECVGRGVLDAGNDRVRPGQHRCVAAVDADIGAAADKTRAAGKYRDARRLVRGPGVDVVGTGLQQPHRTLRQVDLKALAVVELTQMEVDAPLRQAELGHLIVQIGDVEFGPARHADRGRADLDLRAGLRIGRERASGRDRIVDPGRRPLGVAGGAESEVARDIADLADAGRRLRRLRQRRRGSSKDQQDEVEQKAHNDTRTRLPSLPERFDYGGVVASMSGLRHKPRRHGWDAQSGRGVR